MITAMRIPVDFPDDQFEALTRLAAREKVSRASLVRRAVADFLAAKRQADNDAIAAAFGLWPDMEDGLAYQERLRGEWER
jgi:metal-responsive CopG/Arc/MetJ family transcriptional regulator